MASPRRLKRVAQLLQKEVGLTIARSGVLPPDALVTVVGVTLSPDLLYATVRISAYPVQQTPVVLRRLANDIWRLQQTLNKRLRMRPVPKLRFEADGSEEEAARIEKTLKDMEK